MTSPNTHPIITEEIVEKAVELYESGRALSKVRMRAALLAVLPDIGEQIAKAMPGQTMDFTRDGWYGYQTAKEDLIALTQPT